MLLNDSIQVILQTVEGRMGDAYVQFQFTDEVGKPLWFYVAAAGNLNRIKSDLFDLAKRPLNILWSLGKRSNRIQPVSYTHLDVYKRQFLHYMQKKSRI